MKSTISIMEHYERLAETGNGRNDPPDVLEYMSRWDGPLFYNALGEVKGLDVLEAGVGFGRLAREVIKRGCGSFVGVDFSPKTIAAAREDFSDDPRHEFVLKDLSSFRRPESFDLAYSVLTMMHVQNKKTALRNMVDSLRPGGHLVLSIHDAPKAFEMETWQIELYPWAPELYAEALSCMNCQVDPLVPLIDKWTGPDGEKTDTFGCRIATLIKARKRATIGRP